MKKILIATTALVAISAPTAFALDVSTSGSVEYKYTKNKAANKAENPKLSQGGADVKFAAEGASNGLAYGAWVKIKSNAKTVDGKKDAIAAVGTDVAAAGSGKFVPSGIAGWTQDGRPVYNMGGKTANKTGLIYETGQTAADGTTKHNQNDATTQSAMWVSGAFGKLTVGQAGSAAGDLAISGQVKAASFNKDQIVGAGADTASGERVTYTAPTFVDGLDIAYTMTFKGNVDTDKSKKAKGASNWAVKYATDVAGVSLAVAHASGTTSETNATGHGLTAADQTKLWDAAKKKDGSTDVTKTDKGDTKDIGAVATGKARTNTQTGMTATYGNFTVGYGVFTNEKKYYQKKDTSGSAYGVKYASGDWAVGYTVLESEDKNKYLGEKASKKTASTSVYSASYNVAEGFSVYASKSSNSIKKTDNTTAKTNYTIIGAKISF